MQRLSVITFKFFWFILICISNNESLQSFSVSIFYFWWGKKSFFTDTRYLKITSFYKKIKYPVKVEIRNRLPQPTSQMQLWKFLSMFLEVSPENGWILELRWNSACVCIFSPVKKWTNTCNTILNCAVWLRRDLWTFVQDWTVKTFPALHSSSASLCFYPSCLGIFKYTILCNS